jgi:hypothetical protein
LNNLDGPGNPFARKTAAFRQALYDAITPDDLRDVACALLFRAKAGHLDAVKLLFSYLIGKPQPAADPDRLDLQEWQLFQEQMADFAVLRDILNHMPAGLGAELARIFGPVADGRFREVLGGYMRDPAGFIEAALDGSIVLPGCAPGNPGPGPAPEQPTADDCEGDVPAEPPSTNGGEELPCAPLPKANGDDGTVARPATAAGRAPRAKAQAPAAAARAPAARQRHRQQTGKRAPDGAVPRAGGRAPAHPRCPPCERPGQTSGSQPAAPTARARPPSPNGVSSPKRGRDARRGSQTG